MEKINLEYFKKNFPAIVIITILIILLLRDCSSSKIDPHDPNLHFNKSDSTWSKEMQTVSKNFKELKTINDSLYQAIKKIKGEKTVIAETKIIYKTDTLRLPSQITKYNDSLYASNWKYDRGDFQHLEGSSRFFVKKRGDKFTVVSDTTFITKNIYNLDLIVGVRKIKGKEEIFVKSKDPLAVVSSLEGYQIERKKLKFSIGPNVSYGIGSNFKPQVFIGVGVQYNLIRF